MEEKVTELLQKALEENPSLFLISLTVTNQNQITVVIDGDKGVSVEDCMTISRAIEHNLDREEEDFSLEVLSAGVSEPLSSIRQYKKNVGRDLKVRTSEENIEATLADANEETITLKWKVREPKPVGKGKHTVHKEAVIEYKDIVEAKVMIKFN
ncbi:MAG: ribosome assembly cofactor RimP [Flavobacteriaceae bacterium]|nr:ribosome assembly cofactor RimP [Flavobacteriaceae bacterium]|tara:strand:+ start:162 stop:623 length:462 start_codon:yes stop_codon:yes gene_type:complete